MRFGSRCGKDGARRGIARSRAQKFGNLVRLRLAAIRSIRVARFDESSSAAAAITSSSWWSVERTAWSRRVARFEIGHLK